jgi:hypothetical protein
MLTPEELVDRLIRAGIATLPEIAGCSDDEIAQIELSAKITLPMAYRGFLRAVGRGAGRYLNDCTAFHPKILELTPRIRRRFEGAFLLPTKAFVFMERMGEVFTYFEADGRSDDPPVYGWNEDLDRPELAYKSVWELFEQELIECERRSTR